MITLSQIEKVLREADLEGFIELGAPKDEYDSEAKHILEVIDNLPIGTYSLSVVDKILHEIWAKYFGLSQDDLVARHSGLRTVAQQLFVLIT